MVSSSALMAAGSIASHLTTARPSSTQEPVLALERTWHRAPHGAGAGLFNMGNTCYLNSVLQCLAHLPPLANLCHAQAHRRTCARTQGGNTCICCLLEAQLTRQLYGAKGEFRPEALYSHLLNLGRGFVRYRQEDAHELLRCLTDEMERCLLRQSLGYNPQRAPRCPKTWVNSLFSGILQSQVRCLRCGYVSNSYDPFMDLSLELKPGCSDLRQCLRNFTAAETLDGKNCYRCDGCRQLVPAKKQITIWDDPNVLVVHLKRFHDFSGQKISQVISYPLNLNLEEHMCPTRRLQQQQPQQQAQQALQFLQAPRVIQQQQQQQQRPATAAVFTNNGYKRANIGVSNFKLGEQVLRQQQVQQQQRALMHQQAQQHQQLAYLKQQHLQPQQQLQQLQQQQHGDAAGPSNRGGAGHYELHGVLVHKGFTANSGHYYAYVRGGDPASHWYCANDSNVYRPQANEAFGQTRDAYMLFYVRRSMKQQADLPAQPEAPAAAAAAAQPAAAAGAAVAAAAQRLKRSSDVMIGPQLPPHLQQKRQRLQEQQPAIDAMDTDEQHPAAAAAAAGGVFGLQLPPGYQQAAGAAAAAAAANTGVGPSISKTDAAAAAVAAGEAAPAPAIGPLSPAAAAAGAAEARAAAKPAAGQVASSSGSGAAANGSRAGLLSQAAPQPLPTASGQQNKSSPAVTSELGGYLPDYEDEEDVCVQPAAAAAQPAQPLQEQQEQLQEPAQLQQEPQPAAAAAATGPGGSSGSGASPLPAPGDVQAEREQIKSKLRAELSLRSDFKPALVDMLMVARDQGKSWRQVKPMLLMMLRQSAAVKETAEAVFAPFLRMAQTALPVCL